MSDRVCSFGELVPAQKHLAGSKGSTLAQLYRAGYPVPEGFVVLPAAFSGDQLLPEAWAEAKAQLRQLRKNGKSSAFAVRSSALSEDSAFASFAGEFETVLDVHTEEMIRAAIHTVRRSRHSERVRVYSQAQGISTGTKLVVLDCSDAQLAEAHQKGFTCLHGSVSDFTRRDVAPEDKRFLFVMRSVLHYFGRQGLSPVLRHLHSQAKAGELFVHQTACFENGKAAACLNCLYHKMRTNKWYPTVSELRKRMDRAGWRQVDISPAPPLPLTSHDLAGRYRLDGDDVIRIRNEIAEQFGEMDNVFGLEPQGFHASLHYHIFLCAAEPDA